MEREIILLSDIPDFKSLCYSEDIYVENEVGDEICLYESVETEIEYTDLEKAYKRLRIVFKRTSDGKYFTFNYNYSYNWDDDYVTEAVEVFPKETTITIYE